MDKSEKIKRRVQDWFLIQRVRRRDHPGKNPDTRRAMLELAAAAEECLERILVMKISGLPDWPTAAAAMQKLEDLVEELESLEPETDSEAYVRRELLAALDRAHEMLGCLIDDSSREDKPKT